jgi:hypothetical protein
VSTSLLHPRRFASPQSRCRSFPALLQLELHVYKVGVAKNLYYNLYVEAESETQAELALGCDAWSKLDTEAIKEELEDEVYSVEKVPESECSPENADIRYVDIKG